MGLTDKAPEARAFPGDDQPEAADWAVFDGLTGVGLSDQEARLATSPTMVDESEREVFAIHFHPEWVPMRLLEERIRRAFPNARGRLAIPTQHNILQGLDGFAGVEVDCFAREYGVKVQLLVHLRADRLLKGGAFAAMVERTFRYRALQLLDILEQLVDPDRAMGRAVEALGPDPATSGLARSFALRLRRMIEDSEVLGTPRAEMLKNRLLPDYIKRRWAGGPEGLERLLAFIERVKALVKARVVPGRLHTPRELIEEARALGAGVVIPHPPRFWPALLDDLDVDGWEVWNSSTPDHAPFLIDCLARKAGARRPLLAFMGDDTHMSSKIRPEAPAKKGSDKTEIGFQPWDDPLLREAMRAKGQSRERTYSEYLSRIS
jgi:hypothetical protein